MAATNQRIPNFLGGVSQQPAVIKFPGQLRICDNAVPDVTFGLVKRPPGEFLNLLEGAQLNGGMWYQLYRDEDERFLMQIISSTTASDKQIRIWNLTEITVGATFYNAVPKPGGGNYGNGEVIPIGTRFTVTDEGNTTWNDTYLQRTMDGANIKGALPYAVCEIADTTVISNPETTTRMTGEIGGGSNSPVPDGANSTTFTSEGKAFITLDTLTHNAEYVIYKSTASNSAAAEAPTPSTMYRVTQLTAATMAPTNTGTPPTKSTEVLNPDWQANNSGVSNTFVYPPRIKTDSTTSNDTEENDDPYARETDTTSRYGGQKGFGRTGSQSTGAIEGEEQVQGHLLVNGSAFIAKYNREPASGDFESWKQFYKTRYYGTVVLKDGGRFLENPETDIHCWLHKFDANGARVNTNNYQGVLDDELEVNVVGKEWKLKCEAAKAFKTYDPVAYKHNNNNNDAPYAYFRTPESPNEGVLSKLDILTGLRNKILGSTDGTAASGSGKDVDPLSLGANRKCEVIGDGLYIEGLDCGKLAFAGAGLGTGMNVFSSNVEDVSKLPAECKNGYLVKVANSEETDVDDYYLQFEGQSERGAGSWMEVARPQNLTNKTEEKHDNNTRAVEQEGLDPNTMPRALNRTRATGVFDFTRIPLGGHDLSFNTIWTYKGEADSSASPPVNANLPARNNPGKTLEWKIRECGDITTNPPPSFVNQPIQQIFFFRNRLCFGSWAQVVMSRPNDFFNFFQVSSITATDNNPIDISMNDTQPSYINHALVKQRGVMLFSDEGQFLLFSDADVLSGKSVRIKKVSSYPCDKKIGPIDMGTSVMWTSTYGPYARAYETKILDGDVAPVIVEQTRVVPEFLPKDLTNITVESGAGLVSFGKKNDVRLWFYKYFDIGEKRDQSAWYTWHLCQNLVHTFYDNNKLYTVTSGPNDEIHLHRHELIAETESARSYTIGVEPAAWPGVRRTSRRFEACLDSMVVWNTTANATSGNGIYTTPGLNVTYSATTLKTTVTLPYKVDSNKTTGNHYNGGKFYAVVLGGLNQGAVYIADALSSDGVTLTFSNVDLTSERMALGYSYTTWIEFPNLYYQLAPNQFDLDGDVRISGINFEFGLSGPCNFELYSNLLGWAHSSASSVDDYVSEPEIADYTHYESGMILDQAQMNTIPSDFNKQVRIPIQRKNTKYTLKLKIPDPFTTTLISASWDGRYNTRRHVRK